MRFKFASWGWWARITQFGLSAWIAPLLYAFLPFSHTGNILGNIWWSFGVVEGCFAWLFRECFDGSMVSKLGKSCLAVAAGGLIGSLLLYGIQLTGVDTSKFILRDGSCLPVGLDHPVSMLFFEAQNAFSAIPTVAALGLLTWILAKFSGEVPT